MIKKRSEKLYTKERCGEGEKSRAWHAHTFLNLVTSEVYIRIYICIRIKIILMHNCSDSPTRFFAFGGFFHFLSQSESGPPTVDPLFEY